MGPSSHLGNEHRFILAAHFLRAILACIFAAVPFIATAEETGLDLKVSASSGTAPCVVKILGPDKLVKLGQGRSQKWSGCGYTIFWADGPNSTSPVGGIGSACSEGFRHTYERPGTYHIRADIWHPGPDDGPVYDWGGRATVRVIPPGKRR